MLEATATVSITGIVIAFVIAALADRAAAQTKQAEIVFLMGNPAAGKSTVAAQLYATTHTFIDCDQFKAAHPEYDPKNPAALHAWSAQQADQMFKAACAAGSGKYVVDGTGANLNNLLADIATAKEGGFSVNLMYVQCSLETSLRRNAARTRVVPEEVVRAKAAAVHSSFEVARNYVDGYKVINNDQDR